MGSPAGGYDPRARLEVLDEEGIDRVLLYPTIGICWEGHVTDPALAAAYTRAYNRWPAEFWRVEPNRPSGRDGTASEFSRIPGTVSVL